jgi:hypothetical protein
VQAAKLQADIGAGRLDRLEHVGCLVGRDIKLPAEFADIGDAMGAGQPHADFYLLKRPERIGFVGEIVRAQLLNELPRIRAHQAEHGLGSGDIGDDDEFTGEMFFQPGEITLQRGARYDEEKSGLRQPRDGKVALDATALVEHLGVDDLARRHVHIVGAKPLQEGAGIAPFDADLAERGHVEQADAVADRQMFVALVVEPVLPFPGIAVLALLALTREPVGPLPAGNLAEHRAACLQMFMERGAPDVPRGRHLPVGKMVGIEQAERLGDALSEIAAVLLERLGAADVDLPEIEGCFAVVDPLRQRHAGTA